MPDPNELQNLLRELATHRATLAIVLQQRANLGADHAPPGVHHAIADARAAIARLKAALRDAGVTVEDQSGDLAEPDEEASPGATRPGAQGRVDVSGQVTGNAVGINYGSVSYHDGDQVAGDKFTGDKVLRDKYETHHHHPLHTGSPFSVPYPAPAHALIGRDVLLNTIRTRLCSTAPMRLALVGLPGTGKTSLALTLAYDVEIRENFAGGVLMASLGQQLDLASVARRWSLDLGMQLDPRATPGEQLQRIAAQLNRVAQPYLLIVDDVWSLADAQPFLFASPFASLLLTGRARDAFHSVDFGDLVGPQNIIAIPPLNETEAVELLRVSAELPAPNHQGELEALAALVGGLPLLLDAMGRYLRDQRQHYQERWFDAALDDLHSTARRLNLPVASIAQARTNLQPGMFARFRRKPITSLNTRVVVALSISALPRDAQAAFVRLAAFPPDPVTFGVDSAYTTAEATDDMLRLLVRRSLLAEVGEGRFRLHRVLWDWAENHDSRAVRQARRQLADWHADLANASFADEFGAWRLNPDNWQHMLQTWHAAVDEPDALRGALNTILPLLIDQGYARDVLPGLEHALEVFHRVDRALATRIRYYFGQAHYQLAEYDQARGHLSIALSGFQEARSDNGHGAVLSLLGLVERASGY